MELKRNSLRLLASIVLDNQLSFSFFMLIFRLGSTKCLQILDTELLFSFVPRSLRFLSPGGGNLIFNSSVCDPAVVWVT